jgi:predicted RNA-binding protein with PUA-like domain
VSFWIFQSTVKQFDLRTRLKENRKVTWWVKRYLHQMSPGDLVFFWLAGSTKIRGIYGWGTLTSQAYPRDKDLEYGVDAGEVRRLPLPVLATKIRDVPQLKNLLILSNSQGAIFRINEQQAVAIAQLIGPLHRPTISGATEKAQGDARTTSRDLKPQSTRPSQTLVVLLGASKWHPDSGLHGSKAFAHSSEDFRDYLLHKFELPQSNLLDLFDKTDAPSEIDGAIAAFLKKRKTVLSRTSTPAKQVVLFYSGHGGFTSGGKEYLLAIRATRANRGATSMRMEDLAETLKCWAGDMRKFLILDCCFAGSAFKEWPSSPLELARSKTQEAFPAKGTSLLCSSSARDISRMPSGERHTMFSSALLDVLCHGIPDGPEVLSIEDVGQRVRFLIAERYASGGVRPEIHSPDQREGSIATVPLFPNFGESRMEIARRPPFDGKTANTREGPARRELLRFPLPPTDSEDTQKGRWGRRAERDGRKLSAIVRKLSRKSFLVDLHVTSTDGTRLIGPVTFYLHKSYRKRVQPITKIRDNTASFTEITATGPYTVGATVKNDQNKLTPLELDLARLRGFK